MLIVVGFWAVPKYAISCTSCKWKGTKRRYESDFCFGTFANPSKISVSNWTNFSFLSPFCPHQYLQIARKLPSYGSIKFSNAITDFPCANSRVNISIGNKELSIQTTTVDGKCQETKFKITRMRCWRVTTNYNVSIFWIYLHEWCIKSNTNLKTILNIF